MIEAKTRRGVLVGDARFDGFLTRSGRAASAVHWTPVDVCVEAARMLRPRSMERVLDVGSGAGKFCTIASLAMPGIFVGVEQRGHLVHEARIAARALGAWRAHFVQADAFELDWRPYKYFYLYNPFAELLIEQEERIDSSLNGSTEQYRAAVAATVARLHGLRSGTRVVTFHGFGGPFPPSFHRVSRWCAGSGDLELWIKQGSDESPRHAA